MKPVVVGVVLLTWFVAACLVVTTGLFGRLPVPPPLIVATLAGAATVAGLVSPVRAWIKSTDIGYLLAPHLVRFVGIAFLYRVSRGELSPAFVPIGWGDTISAIGAVILLLVRPSLTRRPGWWAVLLWNSFGLADMLLLIATGIRLASRAPEQFALFREMPFGLLPTFFVPLIIATHVFMFVRLYTGRALARPAV